MNAKTLTYVLNNPGSPITLDLFEAERYAAAVVVQPLIGNLVFYSNHGRYEPRLASRWERTQPNVWSFDLREGFKCENGEAITARSFKHSLERSLLAVSTKGEPPIFSRLSGYKKFLKEKQDLEGISVSGTVITFTFDRPIRSGLVEILSFAPFGYICGENLNADGSWKDKKVFISSGPYRVAKTDLGKEYLLDRREEWLGIADALSPEHVRIVHEIPSSPELRSRLIVDSVTPIENLESFTSSYKLVPEYLNAVLFGNLAHGFFSKLKNRKAFKAVIEKARQELPTTFGNHIRASSFYSGESSGVGASDVEECLGEKNAAPLVIEGKEPKEGSFKYYTWLTLKKALLACELNYRFAGNEPSWAAARSGVYDIRMRSTSVGGGAEAWGIDVLFCSLIGPNYPDPSKRICGLIEKFENDDVDEKLLGTLFQKYFEEDAAIVPISHNGGQLYLGSKIVRESLNPTLNVMRFDQLQVE